MVKIHLLAIAIFLYLLPLAHTAFPQQTEIQYLSGTGSDDTVDWDFFCTSGRNSGTWATIPVPSCWELQGFGEYNYGHIKGDERANEKGLYCHSFIVPKTWKDKTINIVFDGSMTDTEVKINGKPAGETHQGAFYRFKYDITSLIKFAEPNLLEATVSKLSENESVNSAERSADYWVFGGIFRPVFLEALPKEYIKRTAINAKADGSIEVDVFLAEIKKANVVKAQLQTLGGKNIGQPFAIPVSAKTNLRLNSQFNKIKTWSPEFPNLYLLNIQLLENEEPLHSITERIGFRTVELKPRDGIYVNGVKIKSKGVNRHSFWPTTGRTTNKQMSIDDVNMLKDMNMNAVRMSHYPPDKHFLHVCDSMGLFVLDELAGWQTMYDTEVGSKLVKEMLFRDINHPSIVMWDNGNEGGSNAKLDHWFEDIDPQKRPLIHPWKVQEYTDTQHYKDWDYGNQTHQHGHRIVFPTEFLHGLYDGGHGAGLEDYWAQMWANPLSAGGFLWVFADEAVVRTDKNGELDTDGNRAPDGIVGPYHEKEGSYFAIKEIWAPLFFERKYITPQFDGAFVVENRYHYINLNQCSFKWVASKMPKPGTPKASSISGEITAPNIMPGHKGILKINTTDDILLYDVLYITATDPHGREIYTWSWPISLPAEIANTIVPTTESGETSISVTEEHILLSANGVIVSIEKNSGKLAKAENTKGQFSLTNGPSLIEGDAQFQEIKSYKEGANAVVEIDCGKQVKNFRWVMMPSGWLKLEFAYYPPFLTELSGISFNYPEKQVNSMRWLGYGPYRVYKNRMKGNTLNVWEKEYNNTVTGKSGYTYPEFKGYHKGFYWVEVNTTEQPFTVVCASENIFLHMLNPELPTVEESKNALVAYPKGNLSFMHGISPIGTKFRTADKTGPQGQKNKFMHHGRRNSLDMELYFNFTEK